ncbi:MAG: prolyl oligopeptidase family serine peptidase, partial [Verrucomicrobia bacterium]|nr:prolyl oligopeptidase family serine peptidase [Verrucomicrobiota bacterium]
RHLAAGPPQDDEAKFRDFDAENLRDMWSYHAVAAILRGHSLLAVQAEVDAARIGVTGISWGGYLSCIAAGIDPRFRVAIPVYGCGFLHENSYWLEPRFAKMPPDQRERWVAAFDPSRYLAGVRSPILFVNGTNDFAYPLDSHRKSREMVPGPVDLSIGVRLPHGHSEGWAPREIGLFADAALLGAPSLARLSPPVLEGTRLSANVNKTLPLERAEVNFTRDSGPWQERQWETLPARLAPGEADAAASRVIADLPEAWTAAFLAVVDSRGATTSSPHIEKEP